MCTSIPSTRLTPPVSYSHTQPSQSNDVDPAVARRVFMSAQQQLRSNQVVMISLPFACVSDYLILRNKQAPDSTSVAMFSVPLQLL